MYTVQVANTDIIGKTLYLLRGVYVYEGYMYIIKETKCLGFKLLLLRILLVIIDFRSYVDATMSLYRIT